MFTTFLLLSSMAFVEAQGGVSGQAADTAVVTGETRINPFFLNWEENTYRIPPFHLIEDGDYMPALEEGIRRQNLAVESIIQNREEASFENTILALDNSTELIDRVAGVLLNVAEAHSNDSLRNLQMEAMQKLSEQNDNIYMNPFLFRRVKRIKEQKPALDEVQTKLLNDIYRQFVLNGAELKKEFQDSLRQVNLRLSELENSFSQNLLMATADYNLFVEDESRLKGPSQDMLQRAAEKAASLGRGGYAFGLDNPTVMPFLQYAQDAALRKEILDAYTNRCAAGTRYDNTEIVKEIVLLRLKKANLLGFEDYGSYALQTRMAQTPQAAYDLMMKIWPAGLNRAKRELAEMKQYRKKKEKYKGAFLPSDWRYYANLVREEKYAIDENAVREYFSVDNVREGIFYTANRLYGITFEQLPDTTPMPTPDTKAYLCKDKDGTVMGVIYLDMVARPGFKSGGAWNTDYLEQCYDAQGNRLNTITSIVCNYSPATAEKPTLLNIDEAQTFFHEFGHALNMLLAEVRYKGLNNMPPDFVELPSQIMEHWSMHPLVLAQYAKHYKTGEPIPAELVNRIQQVLNYGQGFATTELLAAALLDMDYHTIKTGSPQAENLDVEAFEKAVAARLGLIPEIYPRYKTPYFAHTMGGGYSAGYYSYLWAEVLDCDAFEAFEETGDIFDAATALSFRNNILKNGYMYNGMDMYKKFRGREPRVEALLKSRGLDR